MAQRQAALPNSVSEDIAEWMNRRNAQAADLAQRAVAAGRQVWDDATRTGQSVLGRTLSELAALGAGQASGNAPSRPMPGSTPPSWLESTPAKMVGGELAELAGRPPGMARGVLHSAEGLGQGLLFGARLLNPKDANARASLAAAAIDVANYVNKGISDPASVGQDIENAANRVVVGIDPTATPMADTLDGEMKRRFGIGLNQGELEWDVGSLALGSPGLKAAEGLAAVGDATSAADFAEMGFSPAQAERLAQPYSGVGHHSPLSQAVANNLGIPAWLRDSPFNVVKPDGMNQGDFYRFHFQTDPQFFGAGFSPKIGGPGWSGKKLGFQKHGLLGRFWYGTPAPLAGVSAAAGATGLANYEPVEDPTQ